MLDRLSFIRSTACALAATSAVPALSAGERKDSAKAARNASKPLIDSAPALQNAAETSVGVVFAVTADASGWVEYGLKRDLSDAHRVYSGGLGMMDVNDKVAQIRLTGLKPATKYYYRIGADRINFEHGYSMHNLGSEADPKIHSFTTLGAAATGSFGVINDTHEKQQTLDLVFKKLAELKSAAVIWNGDASNTTEKIDHAVSIFIKPHPQHPAYAADMPYMFLNGNHDFRGRFNRHLEQVVMFREPTERRPEFNELGRNFVQRLGDIALIGLDTGEDKLDTNVNFAGIFRMQDYREKQTRWLAEAIESEAVKTAKFKVAFCHIPLFDSRPWANPGDIRPTDTAPEYKHDFAVWQRTCSRLWSPYFEKAGVQLVICAHQHCYRYDPPTADRHWAQIVGGGCECGKLVRWVDGKRVDIDDPTRFPTVIEGKVVEGRLEIKVHDVAAQRVVDTFHFQASI